MDEGFNQYMNILSDADARGVAANLNRLGQSYGSDERQRGRGADDVDRQLRRATCYGFQTYQKTPLMLSMLGGIVGDAAVQRAMSDYAKAWAFKHPSPWDYVHFMNNALKQDLNWFWYYWLWTTESVDGSIDDVTTTGDTDDRDRAAGRARCRHRWC